MVSGRGSRFSTPLRATVRYRGRAKRFTSLAFGLVLLLVCLGCSPTIIVKGDPAVTVFAASSLTDAFKEMGAEFERTHTGTKVTFSFASSSILSTQIEEGAPADVFASADADTMRAVVESGRADEPHSFATNALVVVVPRNSTVVQTFSDLAKPGVKLVLAGKDVPAGKYARLMLANASGGQGIGPDFSTRVLANVRSEESNVRAVLTKVQLGEADAGIVYRTDVQAAKGEVGAITIPGELNVAATYPITVTKEGKQNVRARTFVEYVLSKPGQEILARHGFGGAP